MIFNIQYAGAEGRFGSEDVPTNSPVSQEAFMTTFFVTPSCMPISGVSDSVPLFILKLAAASYDVIGTWDLDELGTRRSRIAQFP